MQKYFDINRNGNIVKCKIYYNDIHNLETAVIFGHGFGGHKDNNAAEKFAVRVIKKNPNAAIITFNWPGHGDDTYSKLTVEKCCSYLHTVIEYTKNDLKIENVFGYATSFGGYIFLRYIAKYENPFKKIALRCPAVKMHSILTSKIIPIEDYNLIIKGKNALVGFDRKVEVSLKFITELKEADITNNNYKDHADNILIMHGTNDEIVPFDDVKTFADENKIEFVAVDGADHRFVDPLKMDFAISEIIKTFEFK